jgi:uncharacterized membrane protein
MNLLLENKELLTWEIGLVLFLLVYGLATVWTVNKKKDIKNPRQLLTFYMSLRGIRFFVILSVIIIYIAFIRVEVKMFLILTVIIYAVYLLFDTLYLLSVERQIKKENGKI